MDEVKRDWSSLPEHLLDSIANRLHTRFDILHFRAVCLSFRSTLHPRPKLQFPSSILTTIDFLQGPYSGPNDRFDLIESTIYAIQPRNIISDTHGESSQTWLVKVEESEPGRVKLKDPLSRRSFQNLSEKLPKFLNLLEYRVMEITRSYKLELGGILKGKYNIFSKVIFTTCLDETDERFAVMAEFIEGKKLSVWRNVDKKWTDIDCSPGRIQDIIYHNRKFYAAAYGGLIMTVDSESLIVTQVATVPQEDGLELLVVYFVESLKDLLLIGQYRGSKSTYKFCFRIFRLDKEKSECILAFDELELEDRALFVGRDGSYSVSAKDFSGCKGNCVYCTSWGIIGYPGGNAWIFNLEECKAEKVTDSPGYSNLFWPPPSWLKQHSSSSGSN